METQREREEAFAVLMKHVIRRGSVHLPAYGHVAAIATLAELGRRDTPGVYVAMADGRAYALHVAEEIRE